MKKTRELIFVNHNAQFIYWTLQHKYLLFYELKQLYGSKKQAQVTIESTELE